jgi:hypothetical protein
VICPECGAEYREGFVQCSTCRIPLVPKPENDGTPAEVERASKELTGTIAFYLLGVVAALILTGIQQWLADAHGWTPIPLLYIWLGVGLITVAVKFLVSRSKK